MLIEAFGSGQLCGQLVLDGSCCFRHSEIPVLDHFHPC